MSDEDIKLDVFIDIELHKQLITRKFGGFLSKCSSQGIYEKNYLYNLEDFFSEHMAEMVDELYKNILSKMTMDGIMVSASDLNEMILNLSKIFMPIYKRHLSTSSAGGLIRLDSLTDDDRVNFENRLIKKYEEKAYSICAQFTRFSEEKENNAIVLVSAVSSMRAAWMAAIFAFFMPILLYPDVVHYEKILFRMISGCIHRIVCM